MAKEKKIKEEKKKGVKAAAPVEEKTVAVVADEKAPEKKAKASPSAKATVGKGKSSRRTGTPKRKKIALTFDRSKTYPIAEAVKLAKENSHEKFDASLDVHFNLGIDVSKGEQQVRGTVSLPHGVGKKIRLVAFVEPTNETAAKQAGADFIGNDEFIDKIKKTEKTDFDLAIAEPSMMKKLGMIAKILGTRGLMPSPKNETVTPDPIKAIAEFKKGKLSFKNDDTGNLHLTIGRKSFADDMLVENFNALLEIVKKAKPSSSKGVFIKSITVCTSMGPGVKVQIV